MKQYELMYILPAKLEEENKQAAIDHVNKLITEGQGIIQDHNMWMNRKLSYPIKHIRQGIFMLVHFTIPPEYIQKLNHELKLDEHTLRHLITIQQTQTARKSTPRPTHILPQEVTQPQITTTKHNEKKEAEKEKASIEDLDKKLEELLSDESKIK